MQSGKCTQPFVSDISVEWLMQAYMSSLSREGKNIHLIPVAINYDRLFEIRNLATEIVSGETGEFSMFTVRRMLAEQCIDDGAVGKIYLTFGKSVSMSDYLAKNELAPVN